MAGQKWWLPGMAIVLLTGMINSATAAPREAGDKMNLAMNITGTVVVTADCKINGNQPIAIEFGDVYVGKISSGAYKMPVEYTLDCTGDPTGMTLMMQLDGQITSFNPNALKTDVAGLGVQLSKTDGPITPGASFAINKDAPPVLTAELVKDDNVNLNAGQEFNGTGVLTVQYQ